MDTPRSRVGICLSTWKRIFQQEMIKEKILSLQLSKICILQQISLQQCLNGNSVIPKKTGPIYHAKKLRHSLRSITAQKRCWRLSKCYLIQSQVFIRMLQMQKLTSVADDVSNFAQLPLSLNFGFSSGLHCNKGCLDSVCF